MQTLLNQNEPQSAAEQGDEADGRLRRPPLIAKPFDRRSDIMKCPHCRVSFHDQPDEEMLGEDVSGNWSVVKRTCTSCKRFILSLKSGHESYSRERRHFINSDKEKFVYPRAAKRLPTPREVPKELAEDFHEACLVVADSPKASAALSRRCLQHLLRDHGGVKKSNLSKEIHQVINSGRLPRLLEGV
jgi:hypothetical protein